MTGEPARVRVAHATGAYDVVVGPGALSGLPAVLSETAPAFRYVVISDDRVAALYAERVLEACRATGAVADLFTFPAGEASKNRGEWGRLTDAMTAAGVGRDAAVVALGGGVTGDLAGFVGATYMRGLPVVQVPTSLVAMIDSSVGGKTGVDTPGGKNLVGAFHPPRAVVADPDVTATLPVEERRQGLAEALKHGAILDAAYFDALVGDADALLAGDGEPTRRGVLRSVELKAGVVEADEREGGYRQVLNFGHTVGHALEAASGYAVGHGTGVALGMAVEAEVGERLGVTRTGTASRIRDALDSFGFPERVPVDPEGVVPYLAADKKARAGRPRYVLLEETGRVRSDGGWSREVEEGVVVEALRAVVTSG